MGVLITQSDISALARPCKADATICNKAIDEAISLDLRKLVGDERFKVMISSADNILLNGGEYVDKSGQAHIIGGLRKALAYFAYSRIVKFGNAIPTRFGTMTNNDQYSERAELKERQLMSEDTYNVALMYLNEVLAYLDKDSDGCEFSQNKMVDGKRRIFKIIGD